MTDRHTGYVVTLAKPLRDDDDADTINALRMVRGVISVEPIVHDLLVEMTVEARVDNEWRARIIKMLNAQAQDPGPGTFDIRAGG
jgi:hypothetical protein